MVVEKVDNSGAESGTKVLIIHNILWSHYKAVVFNELALLCQKNDIDFFVVQIAMVGRAQKDMGEADPGLHSYPHKVLFDSSYEETNSFSRLSRLSREIVAFRPDVLVVPGWGGLSICAALLAKLLKIRTVMAIDSTEMDRPRKRYKELVKRTMVGFSEAFLCYGTKSKEYAQKLGADEDKIFVGCQAVDNLFLERKWLEASARKEDLKKEFGLKGKNFIFVGRLVDLKNVEGLIRSFKEVKNGSERADDWGLVIVGNGEERGPLEKLAAGLDCRDILFLGAMSWDEIPVFLALADVFVLPSLSEPWGLAVNEAMLCHLPVIVSDRCGSAYDLVSEGENGYVFDPTDGASLVNIMLRFVNHDVDLNRMGQCSRGIINRYTPRAAAEKILTGIQSVF